MLPDKTPLLFSTKKQKILPDILENVLKTLRLHIEQYYFMSINTLSALKKFQHKEG